MASKVNSVESESVVGKKRWVKPEVKVIRAGSAEAGIPQNIPDGPLQAMS